jgi:putative endonuclease
MAVRHLRELGYTVLERNFHFSKKGEIDIIARDGEYLVFCEVKMRTNDEYGPPEYAITPLKQHRIRRAAHAYLAMRGVTDTACRFDVVTIRFERGEPVVNLIPNAF